MQRLAQRIVPRLSLVAGLGSLALVVHGLTLLLPSPWTAPALMATDRGFVVAWLDAGEEYMPVRVLSLASDLSPLAGAPRVGPDGSVPRVLLERVPGLGTQVRLVGDTDLRAPAAPEGPSRPCSVLRAATAVRDVRGQTRARMSFAAGGWARFSSVPGGRALLQDRVGPARCYALAHGPCIAASADDGGVVVAWTRSHALGSELVVTRLPWEGGGRPTERVLRRAPSFALALALAAFVGLVTGLAGHAALRALEAARVLLALRGRDTSLDGRIDDPSCLVAGRVAGYRMATAAATLQTRGGDRVSLRPGRPFVVTVAALEGELPDLAATVATFEHVWVVGEPCLDPEPGPYRGEGRAFVMDVLSDRPLPMVRSAMARNFAWSLLDALGLAAVVVGAFASIL